jgi:hypothetical protein
MQTSADNKAQPTEGADLNLYKRAAEVAYQFAKKRSEKEPEPTEDTFGAENTKKQKAVV